MKITVNVPARLTRDILTAAIESGIYGAFWLRNYDARLRADGNGLYIGKPIVGGDTYPGPVTTFKTAGAALEHALTCLAAYQKGR